MLRADGLSEYNSSDQLVLKEALSALGKVGDARAAALLLAYVRYPDLADRVLDGLGQLLSRSVTSIVTADLCAIAFLDQIKVYRERYYSEADSPPGMGGAWWWEHHTRDCAELKKLATEELARPGFQEPEIKELICGRCNRFSVQRLDGDRNWCSWCNDWAPRPVEGTL